MADDNAKTILDSIEHSVSRRWTWVVGMPLGREIGLCQKVEALLTELDLLRTKSLDLEGAETAMRREMIRWQREESRARAIENISVALLARPEGMSRYVAREASAIVDEIEELARKGDQRNGVGEDAPE